MLKYHDTKTTLAEQEAYWQKQLSGELPLLQLPLDHSRSVNQGFTRRSETLKLDEDFYHKLRDFCRNEKISLFNLFLTTFKIMLRRYTGQDDIIVGTLITNNHDEVAGETTKPVVSPIPLRTRLAADLTAIAILGVLKAGAAYLPLDPAAPSARLTFILEDAQAPILLTQQSLTNVIAEYHGQIIYLDTDWSIIADNETTNPTSPVSPDDLAYIIYTSGSTGQPKGVMIEHRALVNFTEMIAAYYDINAFDKVLQFASISFDASAEEIYPTLTRGATLVLRTDEMLASADIFWQQCEAWGLTVLDLPTAYWHQLVGDLPKMERLFPKFIRLVILGGEKARADAVNVWLEHTPPSLRTVNSYGPTEATVVATVYEIADKIDGPNVPIGRPIGNMQAYVLDEQMQPVPVGVTGELHLGGVGLARGYLNRPELTAERFVTISGGMEWPSPQPSPMGRGSLASPPLGRIEGGQPAPPRLYKTGDLARYRPDGSLEFLGRLDTQIKLRGFRIELGEIETTLTQHPDVQEAAVILREDQPGRQRLVAYIVPQPAGEPTQESLSTFLKDKLPDYMLPAAFVTLENLPLTTNGKIDRHTLPAPDVKRSDTANDVVVTSDDPVEAMLIEMWQNLLGVQPIGRQDNFFKLGGHSLLAIQIVTRLRETYDIDLSLRKLFESPTIADLAVAIEEMLMIEIEEAD